MLQIQALKLKMRHCVVIYYLDPNWNHAQTHEMSYKKQ